MEVLLILKVRRLKRRCSPLPWQNYILSVHVSFSEDYGWIISGEIADISA